MENELLFNPLKEIRFFLSIQGYNCYIKLSSWRETDLIYFSFSMSNYQIPKCKWSIQAKHWNCTHVSAWLLSEHFVKIDLTYDRLNYFSECIFCFNILVEVRYHINHCVYANGSTATLCMFLWQHAMAWRLHHISLITKVIHWLHVGFGPFF